MGGVSFRLILNDLGGNRHHLFQHFVAPGLGVKTFFEKEWATE